MKTNFWRLSVVLAALPATVFARGVLLDSAELPSTLRAQLAGEITSAKQAHPEAFDAVRSLAAQVTEADKLKRGRWAVLAPTFRALGPVAYLPMVELLAFDGQVSGLSESAQIALQIGLVEALGWLSDARTPALLTAALDNRALDVAVLKVVAQAIGRAGTDQAVTVLLERARREHGERQLAIWAGVGAAQRFRATQALTQALSAEADPTRAKALVRAIGEAGNAASWRLHSEVRRREETSVRELAAQSLLNAFMRFEGDVRWAASNALMVVDAPNTPVAVSRAQDSAAGDLKAQLAALQERFAHNPTRIQH